MNQNINPGYQMNIPAGAKVTNRGRTTKRARNSVVTVRKVELTKAGNKKVFWESYGNLAYTILR